MYEVDILEVATGKVKRCQMNASVKFHETGSPYVFRTGMCDCNLYALRNRRILKDPRTQESSQEANERVAYDFIEKHGCDHSMPPTRYRALRLHLQDGRTVELEAA